MTNNSLYYLYRKDEDDWGYGPQGTFSVDRFCKGESTWWQQEGKGGELKKKTLVLCDWMVDGYTYEEFDEYKSVFRGLLTEGFVLYAWQGGELIQLDGKNLGLGESLDNETFKD